MGNRMERFDEWIEEIEDGSTNTRGLEHCSLEHRPALKAAFKAGMRAAKSMAKDGYEDQEEHY